MKNSQQTILAVDIGNTSAHFALYTKGRFIKEFRAGTPQIGSVSFNAALKKYYFSGKGSVATVIATVVPDAGRKLKSIILKNFASSAYLIGSDLTVPIANRYKDPGQVGVDRLLNAYAAYKKHARELIIIDFGTAITFDIVSAQGEYLGGVIAPGIEISLEALFQKTALLPRIRLRHPKSVIARDTVESIRVGCSFGIGGLCDRLVKKLRKSGLRSPLVIATGGYARFMKRYCESIMCIDERLVLKGIVATFHARKN